MKPRQNLCFAFSFLLSASLISCGDNASVYQALRMAKNNRAELTKVLNHYKSQSEELKYEAARYLIRYMPYHYSYAGSYEQYCDTVDSILALNKDPQSTNTQIASCSQSFQPTITTELDLERITADYLIRSIDSAYSQWQYGPWARHLTFDDFCEYLLPYKILEGQPLDNWRETLYALYNGDVYSLESTCSDYRNNPRAAVCFINDELKKHNPQLLLFSSDYIPIMRASTLIDKPFGTCIDYTFVATALLRSKGIPVSIDYTPQWPDRFMGHYWNTVLTERRKKYEFNGFESNPSEEHYPDAKFAKVFRMTYKPNNELLELIHQGRALPPTLSNIFCKDVTEEYLETSDITIRLFPRRTEGDNVYLAVFNNFEWKPIYWGYVRGNKARFKGMGRNVLYLPVLWKNEKPIPVGDPFFLDMTGNIRYIRPDTTRHQNIRVNRKFPPLRHVCARRDYLRFGKIEAANKPDFSDAVIAAELPDWDHLADTLNTSAVAPYRYWRFKSSGNYRCEMAELYFWESGSEQRLCGKRIAGPSRRPGLDDFKWFDDNDPLTALWAEGDDYWAGYDFGEPISIDRISYIRRSDGNDILPGAEYELFYWSENHWVSLGRQTAKDVYLAYNEAPIHALFYIKCHSYGKDNRIFEYEDDRITWR